MASQREIRRRIGSAKNIKQITRAMQFVAASKLRRAQEATLASRPYREKLDEVIADLAAVLDAEDHPLLGGRELHGEHNRLLVIMTSDRGLAGALNTNTIRFAAREITEHPGDLKVVPIGRKGRDAMRRVGVPMAAFFEGFGGLGLRPAPRKQVARQVGQTLFARRFQIGPRMGINDDIDKRQLAVGHHLRERRHREHHQRCSEEIADRLHHCTLLHVLSGL